MMRTMVKMMAMNVVMVTMMEMMILTGWWSEVSWKDNDEND